MSQEGTSMKSRTLFAAVLLLFMANHVEAQVVQFRVPIALQWGAKKDTVYIGVSGGNGGSVRPNTYGVDLVTTNNFGPLGQFGEVSSPPPDAEGNRVRFIDIPGRTQLGAAGGLFKYDFRGYSSSTQIDTFVIEVTGTVVENNDLIVSWGATLNTLATGWTINTRTPAAIGAPVKDMLQMPYQHTFAVTSNPVRFAIVKSGANAVTAVREIPSVRPQSFALSQNFPNPFNPTTEIRFSVAQAGPVRLSVYNLLGQEVAQLVNEFKNAGVYAVRFDASGLASGTYLYRMTAHGFSAVHTLMLIK
jgi:hypothetical protein